MINAMTKRQYFDSSIAVPARNRLVYTFSAILIILSKYGGLLD
uniref:Uncharacterized protein n=1 Tax=Rhizobium rhizogenes TaxID=359 RepID=A0A7S5DSN7_RHIRH|nr:hypothetical protein pC5.7c_545 [Rhizobium rhizogenes]